MSNGLHPSVLEILRGREAADIIARVAAERPFPEFSIEDGAITPDKISSDWPAVQVYRSTSQSINNATDTSIQWQSANEHVYYRGQALWSSTSSPEIIRLRKPGWWDIDGRVSWQASTTGYREAWFEVISGAVEWDYDTIAAQLASFPTCHTFHRTIYSDGTTTIRFRCRHNVGAAHGLYAGRQSLWASARWSHPKA